MTIVFGGAPVVNAVVAILMNPPEGGFGAIPKAAVAVQSPMK
jgi:hypothetical protein